MAPDSKAEARSRRTPRTALSDSAEADGSHIEAAILSMPIVERVFVSRRGSGWVGPIELEGVVWWMQAAAERLDPA
jgi:hypothetical protein